MVANDIENEIYIKVRKINLDPTAVKIQIYIICELTRSKMLDAFYLFLGFNNVYR
jgi:hypothetical protein